MLSTGMLVAVEAAATAAAPQDQVAPTEEAATARARQSGIRVEVLSRRSESREVFANPDGTFTAVEHLRPVRVRQDGGWVTPDPTMARRPDGSIGPRATAVGLSVSGGGADTPLARLSYAGRALALTWPGRLPEPELRAETAVYAEVMPGIDLIVRADVDGFAHTLVVKDQVAAANPALAKLTFGLRADGLSVGKQGDGRLTATDRAAGGPVFEAPGAIMWDSGTDQGNNLVKGPSPLSKVAEMHTAVEDGGLTLTPDMSLLNDPGTSFPVYIDPVWKTVKASAWTYVSRAHPGDSYYKFGGASTAGMGLCEGDSACVPSDVKRLFYRMPTSAYAGKYIVSATFTARETWSYSCESRTVQLWRTKGFTENSTWNSTADNWLDHLDSRDVAKGWGAACEAGDVEFDALAAVKAAAAGGWSTTTFGLKASNEGDRYAWKRFADDAYLTVNYNTPPPQPKMSNLSMNPGGRCVHDNPPAVNVPPELKAVLYDADSGDAKKVYAEFRAVWDGEVKWESARIGPLTTGSVFKVKMPSTIPQRKTLSWAVRTYDGYQYSPWSFAGSATACYFTYDASVPAAPVVTSADYPESIGEEPDPWYDGVGRYGRFTADSAANDVTRYVFEVDGKLIERRPATPGGPVTLDIAPAHSGPNSIGVQAFDAANNYSAIRGYLFKVKAGSPARAEWALDDPEGATQLAEATGAFPAAAHGDVTLGLDGVAGTAMQVNGATGYASTAGPVLDTTKSFSVSAWARLPEGKQARAGVVTTQIGAVRPAFELYYSASYDRWIFNRFSSNTADATITRATGTASPQGGEWAHLVGVYDAVAKEIKLYVNGRLQQATPFTTPWNATGVLQIGAGAYDALPRSFFSGEIDDVRAFDRIVTEEEASELFTRHPVVKGRWKLNDAASAVRQATVHWTLDEAAGATRAEDALGRYPAGKSGGVAFGGAGKVGTSARLDGVDGHLRTTEPVLDTTKSFTVTAWAKLPATKPTHASVIATQAGAGQRSGFELYYSASYDRWIFNRYNGDTASAAAIRAQSTAVPQTGVWTHLTGVYDAAAKQIKLYVNGKLNSTTAFTTPWNATGPSMIGAGWYGSAGQFFTGDIDDVRIFNQVVPDSEIARLAGGSPLTVAADDTPLGRHITLYGNAFIDQGAGWVGNPPGGLVLDGSGDYAATSVPVVHTDESFTVAGWVTTAGRPDRATAVLSQEGAVNSGFVLRYRPDDADPANAGSYQIEMPDADAAGAARPTAGHSAFQSGFSWDHVALVYDAFQDEMRLYVNGEPEQTEEHVSWRFDVRGFDATKGLQLGRAKSGGVWGEYWPGVIDDVWAFQGIATQEQIQQLAGGAELDTDT
ncbi:LamG domain-containing protein [Nonomuraea sp. MG754425]|uniref:LamG-like jellyroll fold domain-containing protein n=1 Tax=Nonomuraea sp. MG754425 TaxID=2570319 RepID=UPI001F29EBE2|nr:LamG-like jellyroll fold domain-containing protein [Nonomuraea sp. MG754425]MCF6474753.1 LamG domain-containing protein [Nonomuraea sp. MG754425]